MKTVDLVYFNAGGGHRAAALALQEIIRRQGRPWQVRLVNLTEVLDRQGLFHRYTGIAPEDLYNKRLARGWTLGLAQELKLLQGMIRLAHPTLVRLLGVHWAATEPDLVVSLVPNFNRALYQSVAQALPGVPFVTVMTDLADHPPHFWIEPDQSQHLVCGSARAVEQARAMGCSLNRISLTSGMILRPDFYCTPAASPAAGRTALGLDPQRLTGVVMFGGQGSTQMRTIARMLDDVQLILLCGHNRALAEALRCRRSSAPHAVLDFTPEVDRHLRLGDFFIGKPGPGALSEALHCGLPVITFRNAWTMPQERYNTDWVLEQGVGVVLRSIRNLRKAVDQVAGQLPALRARVAAMDNRAVFELPEILDNILRSSQAPSALAWKHMVATQ